MPVLKSSEEIKQLIHIYCSPAVEAVASLHVLSDPGHHTNCTEWASRVLRTLPKKLRENILDFATRYNQWSLMMDIVTENESIDFSSFYETIESIKSMDDYSFSYLFLGATLIDKEKLRQWIDNPATLHSEDVKELTKYIKYEDIKHYLENITAIREQSLYLISSYWQSIFQKEWLDIYQHILSVVEERWMTLRRSDPIEYLLSLHPDISFKNDEIILKKNTRFRININDIEEIMIFPSVFTAPHLMIDIVDKRLTIYMNLNFISATAKVETPKKLLAGIKAISDETRLKIVKILRSGEKSNQELAAVLSLTPGTVTMHLKMLKDADLVRAKKVKQFVYHELITENLEQLCVDLKSFLQMD